MFFVTKRNRKCYERTISNVDYHFVYERLSDAIESLKTCIQNYNLREDLLESYCFVKVRKVNDTILELLWDQTFDHNFDKITEWEKV